VITGAQTRAAGALVCAAIAGLVLYPIPAVIACNALVTLFYASLSLYKLALVRRALGRGLELPVTDEEVAALDDGELPVYTILVPLYREAAVLPRLVQSLARLDYPSAKLDVKLLFEADDAETLAAARELRLPPHFDLLVVPDSQPKTKPKACNVGLLHAEGEFVVIYDAEDRPDPDQLKKVVVAFRKADPTVRCIQCKLSYFNRTQNLLTRWFTIEYATWFDLLLPALGSSSAPVPLGGTSNHFYRESLVDLGAWDPFNVTEDADLGVRLHRHGLRTAIVDSTTYEEANSEVYNWIRQRSRWMKGYAQTWLVHMRRPLWLRRQIGWRNWFSFQMTVGGTVLVALLNPIYWLLTALWLATHFGVIGSCFPGFVYVPAAAGFYVGNFAFVSMNMLGALRRGHRDLVKYALLSPIYWGLASLAAWKGVLQLCYRPFYWEKTNHGLDAATPRPSAAGWLAPTVGAAGIEA
jgi:cellulose synthase/poly-beta-1,6-N-acetylglucosamine synthase-like glycosyltransferase